MSDEESGGQSDGAEDAEDDGGESREGDQAHAVGDEAETLQSDASEDEHASASEDEHKSLSEEDASEAGQDTDSRLSLGEEDIGEEHEVGAEEGSGVPLASIALMGSLASQNNEEGVEEDQAQRPESRAAKRHKKRKEQCEDPDSLQSLKRQLTEAKRQVSGAAPREHASTVHNADSAAAPPQVGCFPCNFSFCLAAELIRSKTCIVQLLTPGKTSPDACAALLRLCLPFEIVPLELSCVLQEFMEYGKILTEEDFERIRKLRHRKMVEAVMKKHGLKSASKRDKLLTEAEEEAEEALTEQVPASPSVTPHTSSCLAA